MPLCPDVLMVPMKTEAGTAASTGAVPVVFTICVVVLLVVRTRSLRVKPLWHVTMLTLSSVSASSLGECD